MRTTDVGRLFAVLLATTAMAACGGRVGAPGSNPADAGEDTGVTHEDDGGTCVSVDVSSFDTSCNADTDCVGIATGHLCAGGCFGCGINAAINESSEAAYETLISPLAGGPACPCVSDMAPRCISGACLLCSLDPNAATQPPGCQEEIFDSGIPDDAGDDTGVMTFDGGGDDTADDSSAGDDSGGSCVFVDPTTFDTSCSVSSDCFVIPTGTVCDGSCQCGGTPVNVDGESQYEQDIQGITFAECPCAEGPPLACSNGTCVACDGGTTDPPACGDAGG